MNLSIHLRYADKLLDQLEEVVNANRDLWVREFETTSQFNSINKLVAHMVGAEERWVSWELFDEPRTDRYEIRNTDDQAGVFAAWKGIRQKTQQYVDAASSDDLALRQSVTMGKPPTPAVITREAIVFHVFNHQIYHTAQISMLLQQAGVDPPNFDFVLLGGSDLNP